MYMHIMYLYRVTLLLQWTSSFTFKKNYLLYCGRDMGNITYLPDTLHAKCLEDWPKSGSPKSLHYHFHYYYSYFIHTLINNTLQQFFLSIWNCHFICDSALNPLFSGGFSLLAYPSSDAGCWIQIIFHTNDHIC